VSQPESYPDAFARIERAVDAGRTDLGSLGFWRLVDSIKADPTLSDHWADAAGRIDRKAFEAGVRVRVPVWLGNAALLTGTLAGAVAVALALGTTSSTVAGLALVFAGGAWSVTLHDLGHWLAGRLAGIRFHAYFLRGFPPLPGLKTDYATYLRTTPAARAWMHASGAIATKLAPFVALAFWPATEAPAWSAFALLGMGILEIVTDVVFSVRSSDWKRVRRELRIARRRSSNG
jgi:hypothetical protein